MDRQKIKAQGLSLFCALAVAAAGSIAFAQQAPQAPPQAQPQPQAQAQPLAPQQLDNLVAPVALYPDPLLGQVLAASTYPVEVVEAEQWLQANKNLQGQAITDAAKQQPWDASIQAMVAMPDVLAKLNQDIQWTTDLGNAFLAQPADVMAAVQRMRSRAEANGRLQSNGDQTVTTQTQNGQQAIEIEPANPQVVYVPVYDPMYVWGAPAWGVYPPLWYPYYGYGFYPGINIGLFFGGWGGWGFGGWGWGWGPNWFGGGLFVNFGFFNHYGYGYGRGFGAGYGVGGRGLSAWAHDPAHRMGVGYSNSALNARYGAASQAARMSSVRANNFHSFGSAGTANRAMGSQGAARGFQGSQNAARGFQGGQGAGGYQRFSGGRQAYNAPAARSGSQGSMGQRYSAPAQRSSAPSGGQHYSAPSSAGRSFSGGGGFGGGGFHGGGGGGGGFHGGGGGHGGGRR